MAEERVLKARLQNKYETLENWNALPRGSFIPLKGELCFASNKDKAYGYYKVGDGTTDFVDLPWLLNQGDWNENNKTVPGYVKNRPMYTELPKDTEAILEIGYVSGDGISQAMIIDGTTGIMCEGREFDREDIGKALEFDLQIKSVNDIDPINISIKGPVYLKEMGDDDDIIYYYGNFYRFYLMYSISELEEEIASGEITVEQIEQILQEQLQLQDTGENYAFVNMYGTFFAVAFDQTPGDINNFTYEFNIYSYPTIVHKLESKYLEEENLVGKFENIDEFSEIFNDYANNRAQSPYSHAEGYKTEVHSGNQGGHTEGYQTEVWSGNGPHAEGYGTYASGNGAHAEGEDTYASGAGAHSEGQRTYAYYETAHAEGQDTYAHGVGAHTEGKVTYATGTGAHAEGGTYKFENATEQFIAGAIVYGPYEQQTIFSKTRINPPYIYNLDNDYYGGSSAVTATIYSDEITKTGYDIDLRTGELVTGTFKDEWVEQGYLTNVKFYIDEFNMGAVGSYSHTEGFGNTAKGLKSHAEGEGNLTLGDSSHVGGYKNYISDNGDYSFVHGQHLISNQPNQFVIGAYNNPVEDAVFMVGDNHYHTSDRSNVLTLKKNGDFEVLGRITDGEKLNTDIWQQFLGKSANTGNTLYYHLIKSSDIPFKTSELIKPNMVKIKLSSAGKYPQYWEISNGNILPKEWITSKTLDDGTTITLNDDESITVNKVAGSELKLPIITIDHIGGTFCWDETPNEKMYFAFDVSDFSSVPNNTIISNPGQHLLSYDPHLYGFDVILLLCADAETSGTFTIHRPTLTKFEAPDRYLPYMEPIVVNNASGSSDFVGEFNIKEAPFFDNIAVHSNDYRGYYYIYADAVPKSVINENRISMLLNQYIPENQYIINLTQEDSNISLNQDSTSLSLSIKLGQKIDGTWVSNYEGITPKQLELVELFPEAMQSLMISDQNSGFKLPDGIFVNNTTDSEWSMPTRALYDLMSGGNIANITDGHVRLEHGYNKFDTCYLKWYIGLGDGTDEEIEALFGGIMAQLATATHFIFYLPHGRNNIYLN